MSQPPAHQNLKFSEGKDVFCKSGVTFCGFICACTGFWQQACPSPDAGAVEPVWGGLGGLSCNRQSVCQGGSTELPEFRVQEGKELSWGTEREQKSLREAAEKVIFF